MGEHHVDDVRALEPVEQGVRNCRTCGRPHNSYRIRPGLAPQWADPDDGHPYAAESWEAWGRRQRSVFEDVWAMVFPGTNETAPLLKLALIRLREGVADDDPLRLSAAGVLARDLPCGRVAAAKLVATLHRLGWVDEQGWPTMEGT